MTTASGKTAAGTSPGGVVLTIKGLKPKTTYHYRLVAHNATGTSQGQDRTFKTPAAKKKAKHKAKGKAKKKG
jgi:phosphodiesterase/alkaline phosphatase D-like protein